MTVPFSQRISLIIFSGGFRISQTECTNIRCGRYQYIIWQNSYKNERNWTEGVPSWRPSWILQWLSLRVWAIYSCLSNGNWIILEMKTCENLRKLQFFRHKIPSLFMLHNSKLTLLSLLLSLGVKVNLYHLKCRVSSLHGNLVKSSYITESSHYRCQH